MRTEKILPLFLRKPWENVCEQNEELGQGEETQGPRERKLQLRKEEVKGSLRGPAAQMDSLTEGTENKISPKNDEIDRNIEYLKKSNKRHFRYFMKHMGEN